MPRVFGQALTLRYPAGSNWPRQLPEDGRVVDHQKDRKQGAGSRGRPLTLVHHVGEIDGRSSLVVHYRRLVEQITTDLGGVEELSAAQLELCRRASGLGVLTSRIEAMILEERPDADVEKYIAAVHAQARCLCALGLRRRARTVNGPILS
jgi:hypothetical protein